MNADTITKHDLEVLIEKSSGNLEKRIDLKFDNIDTKFDNVNFRIESLEKLLDSKITDLDRRFGENIVTINNRHINQIRNNKWLIGILLTGMTAISAFFKYFPG